MMIRLGRSEMQFQELINDPLEYSPAALATLFQTSPRLNLKNCILIICNFSPDVSQLQPAPFFDHYPEVLTACIDKVGRNKQCYRLLKSINFGKILHDRIMKMLRGMKHQCEEHYFDEEDKTNWQQCMQNYSSALIVLEKMKSIITSVVAEILQQETEKALVRTHATGDNVTNSTGCIICMDAIKEGDEIVRISCGHSFHPECLEDWLKIKQSCPLCRFEFGINDENEEEVNNGVAGLGDLDQPPEFLQDVHYFLAFISSFHALENSDNQTPEYELVAIGQTLRSRLDALSELDCSTPVEMTECIDDIDFDFAHEIQAKQQVCEDLLVPFLTLTCKVTAVDVSKLNQAIEEYYLARHQRLLYTLETAVRAVEEFSVAHDNVIDERLLEGIFRYINLNMELSHQWVDLLLNQEKLKLKLIYVDKKLKTICKSLMPRSMLCNITRTELQMCSFELKAVTKYLFNVVEEQPRVFVSAPARELHEDPVFQADYDIPQFLRVLLEKHRSLHKLFHLECDRLNHLDISQTIDLSDFTREIESFIHTHATHSGRQSSGAARATEYKTVTELQSMMENEMHHEVEAILRHTASRSIHQNENPMAMMFYLLQIQRFEMMTNEIIQHEIPNQLADVFSDYTFLQIAPAHNNENDNIDIDESSNSSLPVTSNRPQIPLVPQMQSISQHHHGLNGPATSEMRAHMNQLPILPEALMRLFLPQIQAHRSTIITQIMQEQSEEFAAQSDPISNVVSDVDMPDLQSDSVEIEEEEEEEEETEQEHEEEEEEETEQDHENSAGIPDELMEILVQDFLHNAVHDFAEETLHELITEQLNFHSQSPTHSHQNPCLLQ